MSSSTVFPNIYYQRLTATPKACYICRSPTTVCLSTLKAEDFIYVCEKHLGDPGFAVLIPNSSSSTPTPSQADIDAAIASHAAKQARKAEKDKDRAVAAQADSSASALSTLTSWLPGASPSKTTEDNKERKPPPPPPAPIDVPAPIPSISGAAKEKEKHKKYELHRGIYAMRLREAKGRRNAVQAKEVGRGLPQVPKGSFGP